VKTRLEPLLGAEGPALLYRAFLEDAARNYLWDGEWRSVLAADPGADHPLLTALFPPPWRREPQAQGGLGDRLEAAFRRETGLGAGYTLAVGSDHPTLPRALLRSAFAALRDGSEAAIIPAEDGGYCAIALRRGVDPAAAFTGIPWSTPEVMERTVERLRGSGASVAMLDTFYDVDRPEDIGRLSRDLAARNSGADDYPRATALALRMLEQREAPPS